MSEQQGIIRSSARFVWSAFKFIRNSVLNLIFLLVFITVLVAVFSGKDKTVITPGSALVLDLKGLLVEEETWVDPVEKALNEASGSGGQASEILVRDVVKVIEAAAKDDKIKAMVLALSDLDGGSLDKLKRVGNAIEQFKAAGKEVFATGAYYNQTQYYLASYANKINLNPMGAVLLEGYGSYPMFYKSALEKLQISTHVFKVGTYKSAVEPFIRDDMSAEAKEANAAWLNELWQTYKTEVAERRGFAVTNFDETFAALNEKLTAANGDMTQYAVNARLVDTVQDREAFRSELKKLVGEDAENHTFNQVSYAEYHKMVIPRQQFDNPMTEKIALVVARGTIVDGKAKAGTIGGESTSALLREARLDDKVKAVVLRIDSGGGSAFASEQIAQEIRQLRAAGKPVIASMGAVAASGGYWIAAPADEIYAAPTTITGSIGIFALFHTAEKAMNTIGVNVDGVGTTELAGFSNGLPLFKGLQPAAGQVLQQSIEHGYDQFLTHVATSRKLEKAAVDKVGQGRVWTGQKALEFGLVDKLGGLDEAIAAAAEKASLKQYDVKLISQQPTEQEKLLAELFGSAKAAGLLPQRDVSASAKLLAGLDKQLKMLEQFNDPNGLYSVCLVCQAP